MAARILPQAVPFALINQEASLTKRPRSVVQRSGRMMALTPDEILAVLKVARTNSARNWAMILLAYRHGLRASEICDLKLGDLDMKAGCVSIPRLKGSLHTVQPVYRHKGQPLLDEVTALRAWLRERESDGSDFLFTSQKGGRLHRSQFFRVFQGSAQAAGLPPQKCHPHALKHSLATHLIAANVNLAFVKQCLGHRAIGSTMKYVAVSDRQATQAAQSALMGIY